MEVRLPRADEAELSFEETRELLQALGLQGSHLEWREQMPGERGAMPLAHAGYEVRKCSTCDRPMIVGRIPRLLFGQESQCGRHEDRGG